LRMLVPGVYSGFQSIVGFVTVRGPVRGLDPDCGNTHFAIQTTQDGQDGSTEAIPAERVFLGLKVVLVQSDIQEARPDLPRLFDPEGRIVFLLAIEVARYIDGLIRL